MFDLSTLELAEAAYKAAQNDSEREQSLTAWDQFSIGEIQVAKTAKDIALALRRCRLVVGQNSSQAIELGKLKWKKVEGPLMKKANTLDKARKLYYLAPYDSDAHRYAEGLWKKKSFEEVMMATDLESAKRAWDRSISRRFDRAGRLAQKKWDEFAMVEAQKAKNHKEARAAYERARHLSPARKFLIAKFFSPQSLQKSSPPAQ